MLVLLLLASIGASDWQFVDVTRESGINFDHVYSAARETAFIAGGVACGDYNNDGFPDLYLVSGAQGRNALYRNNGDGTFTDVAAGAGVALEGRFDTGPLFVDYDGDGHLDLFVGGIDSSTPLLFRNMGDGTFKDVTAESGLNFTGNTFSAAFGDIDRDGDLDMFTAHWGATDQRSFHRNNGDGTFTEATDDVGLGEAFRPNHNFTPNFADLNGDRWPDLLVAADFGRSKVFLNDGTGKLIDSTTDVISDENGMGAAVGDFDNDGDLDWFVSSISTPGAKRGTSGNRLYANRGNGFFDDITDQTGVRSGLWGWGAVMVDFDNDGHLDIFHTNGFRGTFGQGYHNDPSRFFHATGAGSFKEKASELGLSASGQGRGVACFDFDGDGDLDIFVANNGEPPRLYRNDGGNQNAFIRVRLLGRAPNSEAVGAKIEAITPTGRQMREISAGNNFMSQDPGIAHFGLGESTTATIRVTWPDGAITNHQAKTGDRLVLTQPGQSRTADGGYATWVPHITREGGGFETFLEIRNFAAESAVIDLQAWNDVGQHLGNHSLTLEPGKSQRDNAAQLFNGQNVSHIRAFGPAATSLTAVYRQSSVNASEAQIHDQSRAETLFYIYPGNPDLTFDGIALINDRSTPTTITVALIDREGVESQTRTLSEALAPMAKQLMLPETYFEDTTDKMIRIQTTQPVFALFLRGTRPGIGPGLLYGVAPVPHPDSPSLSVKEAQNKDPDQ